MKDMRIWSTTLREGETRQRKIFSLGVGGIEVLETTITGNIVCSIASE